MSREEKLSVRGPSSALTSFLRENNISCPKFSRFSKSSKRGSDLEISKESLSKEISKEINNQISNESKEINNQISNEISKEILDSGSSFQICLRCSRRFVHKHSSLCKACQSINTTKKRKELKKKDLLVVGNHREVLSLRYLCIGAIARHIDRVEDFGYIESDTKDKISAIVARYRMLNEANCKLFGGKKEKKVHLYDCATLKNEVLNEFLKGIPCVESLYLGFCGRMFDTCLETIARNCTNITNLTLKGAFLVSEEMLGSLIKSLKNLENLHLSHIPKFQKLSSLSLRESRVRSLVLNTCTSVNDEVLDDIMHMSELRELRLKSFQVVNCTEEKLLETVSFLKDKLEILQVSRFAKIKSSFFESLAVPLCSRLKELSLEYCEDITEEAFTSFAKQLTQRVSGITALSFKGCTSMNDEHVCEFLKRYNLKKLNLNGLTKLTSKSLNEVAKNRELTYLDVSWIRAVNDSFIKALVKTPMETKIPKLETVKIYGCSSISRNSIPINPYIGATASGVRFLGYEFI